MSQGEYKKFLDEIKGDLSGQSARCLGLNKTYEVPLQKPGGDTDTSKCPQDVFDPATSPEQPVRCVDVCDAEAYCNWAGKRLCGGVGKAITPEDVIAGVQSEWANACSEGGKHPYPGSDKPQDMCPPEGCNHLQKTDPYSALEGLGGGFRAFIDICGAPWSPLQPTGFEFCILAGGFVDGKIAPCSTADYWGSTQFYGTSIGIRCCAE